MSIITGTHWTWEIVNMLLTQNDEYTDKTKETAFLEFVDDLNKVEHISSPRILNTHVPYGWLPNQHIEKMRKIIHVVRNPKDVFVSYFHFKKNFGLSEDWNEFFKSVIVGPSKFYLIGLENLFNTYQNRKWLKYCKTVYNN